MCYFYRFDRELISIRCQVTPLLKYFLVYFAKFYYHAMQIKHFAYSFSIFSSYWMFILLVEGEVHYNFMSFELNTWIYMFNNSFKKFQKTTYYCHSVIFFANFYSFSVRGWWDNYKRIHSSTKRDILQQTDTNIEGSVQRQTGSSGSHEPKTVADNYPFTSIIRITQGNAQRFIGKV